MLTLFDYLPSQNGWKVRCLLQHLQRPYRSEAISIFEGHGQTDAYRQINPTGAVPALMIDDGRVLAESNAILAYVADGTAYWPGDAFARAKVLQWLSFEQNYVESQIGSLRYWTLTGKLARRPPALVESKRSASLRALRILDTELSTRAFRGWGLHHRRYRAVRIRQPRRRGGVVIAAVWAFPTMDRAGAIAAGVPGGNASVFN